MTIRKINKISNLTAEKMLKVIEYLSSTGAKWHNVGTLIVSRSLNIRKVFYRSRSVKKGRRKYLKQNQSKIIVGIELPKSKVA